MKTKSAVLSFVLFLTIISCEKNDAPVLEGDIHGRVSLIDAYGYSVTDISGVQVQLAGEKTELETTTNPYGEYMFQDVPYGNYQIKLVRENYVEQYLNYSFGHIGGDAPTVVTQIMHEVPDFRYEIDSMSYAGYHFNVYMHIVGATKTFTNSYLLVHCFLSQSPDVSCYKYENSFIDFIFGEYDIYWTFWSGYYNFLENFSGTLYCRVYPQIYCNDIWYSNGTAGPHPILPETLGPPSDVFAFPVGGMTKAMVHM
jgi:hypothetical protein